MATAAGDIHVLLVDDEPGAAGLTAEFIERHDDRFDVETATFASDGIDRLAVSEYDCVVSDFVVSDTDGIEFLKAVREDFPDLPFVLFTGKGSEEVASEAISAGVTDYLQKGGGTEQYTILANRVENAVEAARADRERRRQREQIESARENIEEERTFIDQALDLMDDVFYVIGPDGRLRRWNDSLSEVTGYDDEELGDTLAVDFFPDEQQERVSEAIGEALTTGHAVVQAEFLATDGSRTPFEITGSRLTDSDGELIGIIGIGRNIAERKEREDELRRLKEEYETVFDTAQDAIFLYDVEKSDGDYEFALRHLNPAHEETTGFSIDADRGKTPVELLGDVAGSQARDNYCRCVESREPLSYEEVLEMPSGQIYWQTILAPVIQDDDVVQLVGVARDVTERRENEQELERYETIVEATGDPVYTLDEEGYITFVNDAVQEFSGYDEEHLLGARAPIIMGQDHYDRGTDLIRSLLRSDENRGTFEMEIVKADGTRVPCENHLALLPFGDEFRGTVGVLRDISDRKDRERRLENERDRLDEFASVVSHDLRNPLNVARLRLGLAREDCESEDLATVAESHDRMEKLIENLLTLASLGESVGDFESVELSSLVDSCWGNVETRSARIVTESESRIRADRTRLQQLLENLLRNAIEHGGEDVRVEVGDLADGFYLEDDGPGIPTEEYEDVFDAGYSTAEDGTGFGLSIVAQIAEAHSWEISVTTGEDGGARFEITGVEMAA